MLAEIERAGGEAVAIAGDIRDEHLARALVDMAVERFAQPEEIARSALYLASDASSFSTGSCLLVDGGVSVNRT